MHHRAGQISSAQIFGFQIRPFSAPACEQLLQHRTSYAPMGSFEKVIRNTIETQPYTVENHFAFLISLPRLSDRRVLYGAL